MCAAVSGACTVSARPPPASSAADDDAELPNDPGEHAADRTYGSWTYACSRTSAPIGRASIRVELKRARKALEHARPLAGEPRRDEDEELVDEICLEERRGEGRAALEEQ